MCVKKAEIKKHFTIKYIYVCQQVTHFDKTKHTIFHSEAFITS